MQTRKNIITLFFTTCLFLTINAHNSGNKGIVTIQSLLREMADRNQITEYPAIPYRCLQASSYNRESVSPEMPGWFADSDGVGFIRTEVNKQGETEWVLMEDNGPGAITKIWAVCFYYGLDNTTGANINIYLDGEEKPSISSNFFKLVKGEDFIKPPLAAESRRAGNCYFPITYSKSCKVTMDKKAFYNIINYRSYSKGTKVKTFTLEDYNDAKELIDSVGHVLSTKIESNAKMFAKSAIDKSGEIRMNEKKSFSYKASKNGGAIDYLKINIKAKDQEQALRSTIMKISFDGETTVWTPIGDFFNVGIGLKEYSMWERAVDKAGNLICRWIMPFKKDAVIELINLGEQSITYSISTNIKKYDWKSNSMYFHSTWKTDKPTPGFPLFDYNLVKVTGKGIYVGDQFTVLNPEQGWWGEGDEKVYVDDDKFPSHFGTGTEDYYGWAGGVIPNPIDEFSQPFLGNIRVASPNSMGYNTCTRTRVLDAIPFESKIDFNIESSGSNRTSWFHLLYAVNTYFYALPGAVINCKPLPDMASRKIMSLNELQDFNKEQKSEKYIVNGAIEAENLSTYKTSEDVKSIETIKIWGELSNGALKAYNFTQTGQALYVKLTELFNKVPLKICLVTENQGGEFMVYINGKENRILNLNSEHSSVVVLDLGIQSPVDNAIDIKFVCKRKGNLGIDYFTIQ